MSESEENIRNIRTANAVRHRMSLMDEEGHHLRYIYEYTIKAPSVDGFLNFVYDPETKTFADTEHAYMEKSPNDWNAESRARDNIYIYVKLNEPQNLIPSLVEYVNKRAERWRDAERNPLNDALAQCDKNVLENVNAFLNVWEDAFAHPEKACEFCVKCHHHSILECTCEK